MLLLKAHSSGLKSSSKVNHEQHFPPGLIEIFLLKTAENVFVKVKQ